MSNKPDLDCSWQDVSDSPKAVPSASVDRQSSLTVKGYQRADSSFEHIDESIMVLNNSAASITSPDTKLVVPTPSPLEMSQNGLPERVNPYLLHINEKLDLYQAQLDRCVSSSPLPEADADQGQRYLGKLRGAVENLRKAAVAHLNQENSEQVTMIKSNLAYDLGKLDEQMNEFYLNYASRQSTPASAAFSITPMTPTASLVNDYNNGMTLSSSIDVISMTEEFKKASLIQSKVLEQNRMIKEMIKALGGQAPTPAQIEPEKSAEDIHETKGIPICSQSEHGEAEALDYVVSFSPGTSPSQFTTLSGGNHLSISFTNSLISLKNKFLGKKSKSKSQEDANSLRRESSSSSASVTMSASQSCSMLCQEVNSNATFSANGNTVFDDDDDDNHTLSTETANNVTTGPNSEQNAVAAASLTSQTSVADARKKALNMFYSCPKCNLTIFRDKITVEEYTEHIRNCYHPNYTCFICWKLFAPNQFEQYQKHVLDHIDQANEEGFVQF